MQVVDGTGLDARVQTVLYSYNASVQGSGNIRRYDNVHAHPGHVDAHHRHDFDWRTGQELRGSPAWVGVHGWPTLSGFLEQVEMWYWEHRDQLSDPDGVAELGQR